jgi:hypothetical protein
VDIHPQNPPPEALAFALATPTWVRPDNSANLRSFCPCSGLSKLSTMVMFVPVDETSVVRLTEVSWFTPGMGVRVVLAVIGAVWHPVKTAAAIIPTARSSVFFVVFIFINKLFSCRQYPIS